MVSGTLRYTEITLHLKYASTSLHIPRQLPVLGLITVSTYFVADISLNYFPQCL